jgi:hypothetical protein
MRLTAAAGLQNTDFQDEASGLLSRDLSARLSYQVSRDLALVGGYRYQAGTYQNNLAPSTEDRLNSLEIGVDYQKALSLSRRTTVSFTTGSIGVQNPSGATEYRLVGSARLNRDIGRTWRTSGVYTRGVSMIEGFPQPFFADSLAAYATGSVSERVSLYLTGGYSKGELGLTASATPTNMFDAMARLRVTMTRLFALSGQYVFYRYQFDGTTGLLPLGIPSQLNRQGLRFGVDIYLPFIR